MTLKSNAKFEEELTCCFKIDMGNLTNSDQLKIVPAKKVNRSYLS